VRSLCLALALALAASAARAQQDLNFRAPAGAADATTITAMRDLAGRALPVYQDADREQFLTNLFALQMASQDYGAAYNTRQSLKDLRRATRPNPPLDRSVIYDMYSKARAAEQKDRVPFEKAFAQAFSETATRLSDRDAYTLTSWLATPPAAYQDGLQRSLDQHRGKDRISLGDAVSLAWSYLFFDAYRSFGPLVRGLTAEDDRRRYVIDDDLIIPSAAGAHISAVVYRPRNTTDALPTLLEFTIYVSPQNYARECAAHGYAGVVAYSRGRAKSPDAVAPYEHDGADARAVIDWIAAQPWSDARVAMYGNSYSAFAAWAAVKHLPPALKAIAASDGSAPGIDTPMQGNIFRSSTYPFALYVTSTNGLDEEQAGDAAHWQWLDRAWYSSGKPYKDLDQIDGTRNPIFRRWLKHPAYDSYWQEMIPFRKEFAHIRIPVLATAGYFDPGLAATLYYFTERHRYDPRADQTLLVGPYDGQAMRRGPLQVLQGYPIDSAALVDLHDLRYQWFDYVLRGGRKPALLKDRVNFEVMGANQWRHVPTLQAMAHAALRFYLDPTPLGEHHHLSRRLAHGERFVEQKIDFADRSDVDLEWSTDIVAKALELRNSVVYVSDPFQQATEVDGSLSGQLSLIANKMDLDVRVTLYELTPAGDYLRLFEPYELRASYAADRSERHLLAPGESTKLAFTSERLTSRMCQAGSRLVLALGINKRPSEQINYGTAQDVSAESIADAKVPLHIKWLGRSFIQMPVWH
jgi:putative CocE/NonD family hydrolase